MWRSGCGLHLVEWGDSNPILRSKSPTQHLFFSNFDLKCSFLTMFTHSDSSLQGRFRIGRFIKRGNTLNFYLCIWHFLLYAGVWWPSGQGPDGGLPQNRVHSFTGRSNSVFVLLFFLLWALSSRRLTPNSTAATPFFLKYRLVSNKSHADKPECSCLCVHQNPDTPPNLSYQITLFAVSPLCIHYKLV